MNNNKCNIITGMMLCTLSITLYTNAQQVFYDAIDFPQLRENTTDLQKSSNEDLIMLSEIHDPLFTPELYFTIHRTDQNGALQFCHKYTESSHTYYDWTQMAVSENGILVTGTVSNQIQQFQQLAKLFPDGSVAWAKKYHHMPWEGEIQADYYNYWNAIIEYEEGSYLLGGTTSFLNENQKKTYAHFAKVDVDGVSIESNLLDLTNYTDPSLSINKIVEVGSDLIAIGSLENQGHITMIVIKLDANLQVSWAQEIEGGSAPVVGMDVVAINNTDFIITGTHTDVFALKMNISGQVSWIYAYKWTTGMGYAGRIHLGNNGDFYLTGHAYINKFFYGDDHDLFILKANSQGNLIDVKYFGKDNVDEFAIYSVHLNSGLFAYFGETDQESRLLISGANTLPFICGYSNAEVTMIPNEYAFTPLQIEQRPSDIYSESLVYETIPVEYNLDPCGHIDYGELEQPFPSPVPLVTPPTKESSQDFHVFPNPSSDQILISWKDLPGQKIQSIMVYDLSGRKIHSEQVQNKWHTRYRLPESGMYILLAVDQHHQIVHRTKAIRL